MCQALSEGGRRCPVHRRDSIAVMFLARQESTLSADVVENLFSELRREGRHLSVSGLSSDSYEAFAAGVEVRLAMTEGSDEYSSIFRERGSDEAPPADTLYALQRIRGAAMSRATALNGRLGEIAGALGVTPAVARQRYDALRASVDTSRGSETPAEYTTAAQQAAFDADLPHDRASVVALARLTASPERESEPRCVNVDLTGRSSVLHSGGYDVDGGRMEIRFASDPSHTYAYHDVPEEVWTRISEEASNPMAVYSREVRGNRAYMYATPEDAAADSHRTRCAACGQFAASSHSCPERRVVAVAESMGVTLTPDSTRIVAESATSEETPVEEIEALVEDAAAFDANPTDEPLADWELELLASVNSSTVDANDVDDITDIADVPTVATENDDADETDSAAETVDDESAAAPVVLGFERPVVEYMAGYYRYTEAQAAEADAAVDALLVRLNNGGDNPFTPPTAPVALEGADLNAASFTQRETDVAIPRAVLENRRYTIETYIPASVLNVPEGIDREAPGGGVLLFRNPQTSERHFVATVPLQNLYGNYSEYRVNGYHSPPPFEVTPPVNRYYTATVTDEARVAAREAYRASADGQLTRTEVVPNSTRTRAYVPSVVSIANSSREVVRDQATQWAGVRDVRRVLAEDGATVSARVNWSGQVDSTFVDQHGYAVDQGSFHVSGALAITNEGGTLRTTSGAHELRCSCDRYRRTYHCTHVDYVRNNGPRMAARMNARPERVEGGAATGPYPQSLLNRSGFSFRTGEDGTHVGVFSDIDRWGGSNRRAGETFYMSATLRPEDIASDGVTSVEQAMRAYAAMQTSINMSRSAPVLSALRRGPVDMNVGAPYLVDSEGGSAHYDVAGAVHLVRDENGVISATQGTLRCTCGRFTSADAVGRTCPHVVEVANAVAARLSSAAQADPDEQQFAARSDILVAAEAHHEERLIRREIQETIARARRNGETITEEEARTRAAARIAEREAEREAERLRYEARRVQQEAQEAERRRVEAMSYAERAEHARRRHLEERASWLESRSEFATNLEAYRAAREAAWAEGEEGYGDNIALARADVDEAVAAKTAGNDFIAPLTENVTDGICDPNVPGSRRFGVELEFDFQRGVDREEALRNIVRELREAGLTDQSRIGHYHSGRSSGWSKWNLEEDCTVSGELVSPLMSDTPEDWEQMKTAIDILNRNGAIATTRTGSHVHISTGSYVGSVAKHTELIRTVQDHQDVLYRAAANPKRGTHRGTQWCGPNTTMPSVSVNADDPTGVIRGIDNYSHTGHGFMMNLEGTTNMNEKAHAEFRMWDASLNLAVIQQQVATSAALADYADRKVQNSGESPGRDRPASPSGVAHGTDTLNDDALKNATDLADKIFRRQSDRKRFMALVGVNKWA